MRALNEPRPTDITYVQLAQLVDLRDRMRGELIDRLNSVDAISRRIDKVLDELLQK